MNIPSAEEQSIFGPTYQGVPNPQVAHEHPYPTRYHGPVYTTPRFPRPYQPQSWTVAGGNVQTMNPALAVLDRVLSGLGGEVTPLDLPRASTTILDTFAGAALGYIVAPRATDRAAWAAAGAAGGWLAGLLGIVGVVGAGFYVRQDKSERLTTLQNSRRRRRRRRTTR